MRMLRQLMLKDLTVGLNSAKIAASLIRIMYRIGIISHGTADRFINKITVKVLQAEMEDKDGSRFNKR